MDKNANNPAIGCLTRFGCFGVILLVVVIIASISQCSYNSQNAVEFTSSLESGKKAYVDIVTIEPRYGKSMENSNFVYEVICKCTTKDNSIVWISMSVSDYNEFVDADAKLENFYNAEFDTVRFASGIRIQGKVWDAEDKDDGLSRKIGANTLLDFETIIK